MNFYDFIICLKIMFLSELVLTHPVPEASDAESEIIHDNYRSRHNSKYPKEGSLHRPAKRNAFSDDSFNKQCAIMYKDEDPVGILQPFEDNYRLLPLGGQKIAVEISPITKRKKSIYDSSFSNKLNYDDYDTETDKEENNAYFTDQRYPYIFAKFKVDSRLDKAVPELNSKPRDIHKRESRNSISKMKTNQAAEFELKNILKDMGLMEQTMDKREADEEDENLESGTNRIELLKAGDRRHKRDSTPNSETIENKSEEQEEKMVNLMENEEDASDEKEREKREMEERLEAQIKDKLERLKEEVKREIEQIKSDSDKTEEEEEPEEQPKRRKRFVTNTLIEEETPIINPLLNPEEHLKPKIRRRRNLNPSDYIQKIPKTKVKKSNNDIRKNSSVNENSKDHLSSCHKTENRSEVESARFISRSLKQVGAGLIKNKNYKSDKQKRKSCSCDKNKNGDCKCGSNNYNRLKDEQGENFYYVDDVPDLRREETEDGADDTELEDTNENIKRSIRDSAYRGLENGRYYLDIRPDVYKITSAKLQGSDVLQKRSAFDDLINLHGGRPVLNHLVAIRERSMFPYKRQRRMASQSGDDEEQQLQLIDMPEEDLFGPLPQGFDGELPRFKRVKRRNA